MGLLDLFKPKKTTYSEQDLKDVVTYFKRSIENPAIPLDSPNILKHLGFDDPSPGSGIHVTEENSVRLTPVYGAVRVLARSVSALPLEVFERNPQGKTLVIDSPQTKILKTPNPNYTAYSWLETMMTHALLWGNHYSLIRRNEFAAPLQFDILNPWDVTPKFLNNQDGTLKLFFYEVKGIGIVEPMNMLHIKALGFDGLIGKSPIRIAREAIGVGMAQERYQGTFYSKGSIGKGMLIYPPWMSQTAKTNFEESFNKNNEGIENLNRNIFLEDGVKYQQLTIPQQDAQFIESRNFSIQEISRMFGVFPWQLAEETRSTFNNIEEQNRVFLRDTLRPWLVNIEQELDRKIYPEGNVATFTEFNIDALMRGDAKARSELYNVLFRTAAIDSNEIRAREGMNPYEGGDTKYIFEQLIPVDKVNQLVDSKTNQNE